MAYSIEYFHSRVLAEIEAWPADVLADYTRLVELLMEHGPNLRLPHSRVLVMDSLSFARGGALVSVGPFTVFCSIVGSSSCTLS